MWLDRVIPYTVPQHLLVSTSMYSGGFRGGKVMYFCVHNFTSLSNDYAAVACNNNNQAQLSVSYWSPDIWLGLELLWDIQFGLPAIWIIRSDNNYVCREYIHITGSGRGNPIIFGCTSRTSGWTKFLNPPLMYVTNLVQMTCLFRCIPLQCTKNSL